MTDVGSGQNGQTDEAPNYIFTGGVVSIFRPQGSVLRFSPASLTPMEKTTAQSARRKNRTVRLPHGLEMKSMITVLTIGLPCTLRR